MSPEYEELWRMAACATAAVEVSPVEMTRNTACPLCKKAMSEDAKLSVVQLQCGHVFHGECGGRFLAAIAATDARAHAAASCPFDGCTGASADAQGAAAAEAQAQERERERAATTAEFKDPILECFRRRSEHTKQRRAARVEGLSALDVDAASRPRDDDDDDDDDEWDADSGGDTHSEALYRRRWEARRPDGLSKKVKFVLMLPYGKKAALRAMSRGVTMNTLMQCEEEFTRDRDGEEEEEDEAKTEEEGAEAGAGAGILGQAQSLIKARVQGSALTTRLDDTHERISVDRFLKTGLDIEDIYFGLELQAFPTLAEYGLDAEHITGEGGKVSIVALVDLYRIDCADLASAVKWDAHDIIDAKLTAPEARYAGVDFATLVQKFGLGRRLFVDLRFSPKQWRAMGLNKMYMGSGGLNLRHADFLAMGWPSAETARTFSFDESDEVAFGIKAAHAASLKKAATRAEAKRGAGAAVVEPESDDTLSSPADESESESESDVEAAAPRAHKRSHARKTNRVSKRGSSSSDLGRRRHRSHRRRGDSPPPDGAGVRQRVTRWMLTRGSAIPQVDSSSSSSSDGSETEAPRRRHRRRRRRDYVERPPVVHMDMDEALREATREVLRVAKK